MKGEPMETTSFTDDSRAKKIGGSIQTGLNYWARYVVWIQAVYYLLMGMWPMLSMSGFEQVTGPKTDVWLVKTVGLLLVVIGFVLIIAAYRRYIRFEIAILGIGCALTLVVIELVYVTTGVISPVYLLDAIFQILLVVGWIRRDESYT
jgi:hypothetical protein